MSASVRTSDKPRSGRWSAKMTLSVVLAVLALIFVFQNTGHSVVYFLVWTFSAPAWLWMLILFVAGVAVGSIFPWFRRRPRR